VAAQVLEGLQQFAINVAEGDAQAAVRAAEGQRQSAILRAEGGRKAAILEAEGRAQAIETVYSAIKKAGPDPTLVAILQLDTLARFADSDNAKIVVPYESAALLGAAQALRGVLDGVPSTGALPNALTSSPDRRGRRTSLGAVLAAAGCAPSAGAHRSSARTIRDRLSRPSRDHRHRRSPVTSPVPPTAVILSWPIPPPGRTRRSGG